MPSTGLKLVTAHSNVDDAAGTAWTDTANITADDGAYAFVTTGVAGHSDYLVGNTADLSAIPNDATIHGVTVRVKAAESQIGLDIDLVAQLQDDTAALIGTTDTVTISGAVLTDYDFGGSADVWGATLTPAIVKHANFGVRLTVGTIATGQMRVDAVSIDVQYTLAGPPGQKVVTLRAGVVL